MIHKTTRSILSVLLAALLLVTSIPLTPAFADGGAVSPQSESGEGRALEQVDGVYQIYTADDLKEFADIVNGIADTPADKDANAKLMNDIDLNGSEENPWTPIGNIIDEEDPDSFGYTGTFNGDGHTISGLYIDSSSANYQGLFGYLSTSGDNKGTVKDLTVSGDINGNNYVGGVVGLNLGSVENCHNTGSVTGTGDYVGGVVGDNRGTFENCAFTGSVSGNSNVGGVVGYNSGTVKNCYNTGNISGRNQVGGVVGQNSGGVVGLNSSGIVTNCYNIGEVSGNQVGGVVGDNGGTVKNCYNTGNINGSGMYVGGVVGHNRGSVENCYNTGSVSGNRYVGGVVGWNISSGNVTNCYNTGSVKGSGYWSSGNWVGGVVGDNRGTVENCYNTGTVSSNSNTSDVGGVVGQNFGRVTGCYFLQENDVPANGIGGGETTGAAAVNDLNALCNAFNDTNTWTISDTLKRPVLKDNHEDDGSKDHPYEIFTATQLKTFRDLVNDENGNPAAWAVLMNDIDLSSVCGAELSNGTSWEPIGNEDHLYTGTFDGNGKTISGLYINRSADYQGLFGYLSTDGDNKGTVKDLSVSGSVKGNSYVGGVVGYNNGGTVTGCIFSGSGSVSVTGNNYVGGIVGDNRGSVENCYNTGTVSGNSAISNVGGVVGRNFGGTVENCYNIGDVSGKISVGGVVGHNVGPVKNCYNIGEVSGNSYVGGVVGSNAFGATVTNCYFLQTADVNVGRPGIGEGSGDATATEKDDTAFHSGEVAHLLGEAWGQSALGTDNSWPTLVALDNSAKTVYKVTVDYNYDGAQNKTTYTNDPAKPAAPAREGYTFGGWDKTGEGTTTITYTAKWTAEEPPYTGKYSYEISTSVGDNGALSVDRYATEGDKVTIDVTPDQAYKLDELVVTANGKDVELTANSDGTYTFTMPSADVKISATFAEDPDWTPDEPEEPATDVSEIFTDIAPNAWYKDAIQYAYDNGLMTGVSATEFAPEQTTTRAMIVSILARLEGVTTAQAAGFADVDDNDWYATAVNWAANVGVVNGYEDNTFKPNTAITREQLAAILMNYAAYKGEDVSNRADLTSYTDQPSTWAQEAMQWAVAEGLINGVTNDQLQPQGNATRAQVAAILERFLAQ